MFEQEHSCKKEKTKTPKKLTVTKGGRTDRPAGYRVACTLSKARPKKDVNVKPKTIILMTVPGIDKKSKCQKDKKAE